MKTFSGLILILLLNISLSAQNVFKISGTYLPIVLSDFAVKVEKTEMAKDTADDIEKTGSTFVEEMPTFQGGGLKEFVDYVQARIEYSEVTGEDYIQGRVVVGFTVEKDGNINDVEVLKGLDPGFDSEVIRVVSSSPKWEPGKVRGEPVNVRLAIPVKLNLD